MARMRTIKPGFFTNEDLVELPPLARLLFAGLWCWADREGRLADRPKRLKIEILPHDDCDVDDLLEQLAARGFLVRYAIQGRRYLQVVNFVQHQNPHYKEIASTLPAPDGPPASGRAEPREPRLAADPSKGPTASPSPNGRRRSPDRGASDGSSSTDLEPTSVEDRSDLDSTSAEDHAGLAVPAMGHGSWDPGNPAQQEAVDAGVSLSPGAPAGAGEKKPTHSGSARGNAARRRALLVAIEDVDRWRTPANSVELAQRVAAARALLESAPPVTPAEVPRLVERWDQDHDPELCTPMALARNLTQLRGPPATPTGRRRGAPFRDDRSAAEKAREPVRAWRDLKPDRRAAP